MENTMGDIWIDRLSEYLDGGLNDADREAIEHHLANCVECKTTLEQLRAVTKRAAALDDRPPENNLWDGIAARIGTTDETPDVVDIATRRKVRRTITFSLPQLVAAGIALVVVSAGTARLIRPSESQLEQPRADAIVRDAAANAVLVGFDVAEYEGAVEELKMVLEEARGLLDPNTVQVLEQSLATIDRAIVEAQEALRQDPANGYLTAHLAATMKRKVELLQRAAAIVGAARS